MVSCIRLIVLRELHQETFPPLNPQITVSNSKETTQRQESDKDTKRKRKPGS